MHGGPDVLEVVDLPEPVPGPGEVLIRVAASTVNPADTLLRRGLVPGITGPLPHVPGLECAGVVAAVGAGSRWQPGQRVAAITSFIPGGRGCHAELVVAPDASVGLVPEGMDLAAAATIPMSGLTALLALDRTGPGPRTVAVTGAGGAVGAFVLELAREAGVPTIAVVRQNYFERARSMGAAHVVDAVGDWVADIRAIMPGGVDALIDCALIGEPALGAIRDGGKLFSVRGFSGAFDRGVTAEAVSVRDYHSDQDKLQRLLDLAAAGKLSTFVHARVPFASAAEAHRMLEAGGMGGRAVLMF